ncbi:hypothetical protein TL16_g00886 [Triparma laevis f. inornata]|uniref:Uncharacterized protein n=2 Tax=Triparma laevis TaxID=1534972 RepID=A0A9W7CEV2_9STRA|nr:hypothetical protein TL16_g00886 [Triparma laevis f. inornata]GMI04836.1 hypothetical protein TrLO_g15109 [Triparma laevis f. longispina]
MKLSAIITLAFTSTATAFKSGYLFSELETAQVANLVGTEFSGAGALLGCKTEHKVDDAECGELCIDSTIAYLAEKFGGVTPGACADEGYTVFDHTETVSMGPLGDAEVKIYTKP